MLTARDDDVDKILGLELGGRLTKPFNPRNWWLVSRQFCAGWIESTDWTRGYHRGRIQLDLDRHQVTAGGQAVDLTRKFELLELLIKNPGRVFSRKYCWAPCGLFLRRL